MARVVSVTYGFTGLSALAILTSLLDPDPKSRRHLC
jgi:hypothetical protein